MTANKNFKRQVRARMERTGETYQQALQAIQLGRPEPVKRADLPKYGTPMSTAEVIAEYGEHLGVPLDQLHEVD